MISIVFVKNLAHLKSIKDNALLFGAYLKS